MRMKKNAEIGNTSFDKKKGVYKQSDFLLTRSIADDASWTPDSIQKRQARLAELALKTWSLSVAP
jgi:hypothetical protein